LGTIQFPAEKVQVQPGSGHYEPCQGQNKLTDTEIKLLPPFTMTVADMPGLIKGAAEFNRGLGHSFLRHIERCPLLVYIIDIAQGQQKAVDDLQILLNELEMYQPGLAYSKQGLVLANKADEASEVTRPAYQSLCDHVHANAHLSNWEVIPISAKDRKNIQKAVWRIREVVERYQLKQSQELEALQKSVGEHDEPVWMRPDFVRGIFEYRLPDARLSGRKGKRKQRKAIRQLE
jgi:GTP-binding protein